MTSKFNFTNFFPTSLKGKKAKIFQLYQTKRLKMLDNILDDNVRRKLTYHKKNPHWKTRSPFYWQQKSIKALTNIQDERNNFFVFCILKGKMSFIFYGMYVIISNCIRKKKSGSIYTNESQWIVLDSVSFKDEQFV